MIISFDLVNILAAFQFYVNKTFHKYLNIFVIVYLNDIVIYFSHKKNHEKYVHKIFEILIKADFYVKLFKCYFNTCEIDFLNYQVVTEEIFMKFLQIKIIFL